MLSPIECTQQLFALSPVFVQLAMRSIRGQIKIDCLQYIEAEQRKSTGNPFLLVCQVPIHVMSFSFRSRKTRFRSVYNRSNVILRPVIISEIQKRVYLKPNIFPLPSKKIILE